MESQAEMKVCLDVDYRDAGAVAACLLFEDWPDPVEAQVRAARVSSVSPYVPGRFFERELPCLLQVLKEVTVPLETIVIDGFVWVGSQNEPGLGAHLYEALPDPVPVIGVAKNRFRGACRVKAIYRGESRKPLFVSAVGLDLSAAAECIRQMHGHSRIPTLLKKVDRFCREMPLEGGK